MMDILNGLVSALTNDQPGHLPRVLIGLSITVGLIYYFKGRFWALLYFATIPFLNWSFGIIDPWAIAQPNDLFEKGIELHPLTMVTGLVFVFRDFVQRGMGHKVLIVMALAIAWSFYYAWPVIALASGIAFAISEITDWLIFTFTKYRLSTRIILSSAVAAPVDTTIFLYGADLARQMRLGDEPGNMLHWANWVVFIIGKMVGAVIVSWMIRQREEAGEIDPYDDDGFKPDTAKA
ncbi:MULTISPECIES: VUT family protein [Henriciella]|uniref:VUT family protein n=1 Tax=Henriciella TaxID=453849 RepID=UPI00351779A9